CRAMLSTHMQTEPSPETVALASRMRAVAPPRRRKTPTPPAALSLAALLDGPLLGRTAELSTLIKLYHAAQHGQAQAVLLEGEMGIGKTRLASEFLAWAEIEGADVLQGQAFDSGGQLPYRPVVEALRPRIERENAPDDLLSDTWLAELARLLPEVGDRYPDLLAGTAQYSVARHRLFEAVVRLGQALAERAPLVFFIDDVQWADVGSLDLLHYLARRFAESQIPAFLLLTLRLEEREMRPALAEWRTGMERAVPLIRLPLGPLALEDVLRLLRVVEGGGKPAADLERFGQWVFVETEGQPFYLMETLKVLLERGILAAHPKEEGGWAIDFTTAMEHETVVRGFFPPSVREVIRARLDRLMPNALALLVAGTVLGQASTFEHLCQVADLAEQDGLSALDEVLHSGLLQESEPEEGGAEQHLAPGRYVFAHAQIRAVVSAEAGEARRSIFHRRALQALQATSAPAAELAYHALAAGLAEPAFHWSLAAGDEALRVAAVHSAIAFYEQAQQLLAERVQGHELEVLLPSSQVEQLYTQLGRAYERNAEWEKARAAYTLLLTYAQDASLPVMERTALTRLATLAPQ
ncbi:MAG TPA: AAA family ATPase, partial [Ktedonobacteraceae bacterium]|nr:AAA family ATPase [Ktedonobacteraceae bacterium]